VNSDLIHEWKKHQIRSVHQDTARAHVLEQLDDKTILVYIDWAMKFLPLKYREAQRDWFGKRGLSWHVAYVIRLGRSSSSSVTSKNRIYEHRTFAHVFNMCTQNGRAIVSILTDRFRRLKQEDQSISKAYVRCDNAGCYHGVQTLLSVKSFKKKQIFACVVSISANHRLEKAHATEWLQPLRQLYVVMSTSTMIALQVENLSWLQSRFHICLFSLAKCL
jgi:hypothetical protein